MDPADLIVHLCRLCCLSGSGSNGVSIFSYRTMTNEHEHTHTHTHIRQGLNHPLIDL